MDNGEDRTPDVSRPRAAVTLPNGQHLQAVVVRRRRDRLGVWWYDLEIELPDRADDRRHGPFLTSRTIVFSTGGGDLFRKCAIPFRRILT
ncbi:hypothetical protein DDE74_39645 [Streptomyces lydicus]|uniref:Uncharacterized protein n=1 Tax=Streptomyces lydicus TaxID=47763 RepID=A0A3S9YM88_9ACTN|nr:hypothetical protein DDE74_39645 [Streptomyces lydicus]